MHRLEEREAGCFYIDHPTEFRSNGYLSLEDVEQSFDFAYDMTFARNGRHRDHRSGGQAHRRNGEIFIDAFQGKLSEYAFYNVFSRSEAEINSPDTRVMGLKKWDSADFIVNGVKITVKSTKSYGNLLLLETKDWDEQGRYIPNIPSGSSEYDFFVLIRIDPDGTAIMKESRLLYSDEAERSKLHDLIATKDWKANLAGYITRERLVNEVIREKQTLPKNSMLNGKTRMDAENYYVQCGDLSPMSEMVAHMRSLG